MVFIRRTEAPTEDNYWYESSDNKYNNGEDGIFECGGNCTAYTYGRSAEAAGEWLDLPLCNAKQWWDYNINNDIYPYGNEPKLGAVAVFTGTMLIPGTDDTYGHVAFVEQVDNDGFETTESAYSTNPDDCILWHEDYYELDGDGNVIDGHGHGDLIGFIYPREYEVEDMTRAEKEMIIDMEYCEWLHRGADRAGIESYVDLIPNDADYDTFDTTELDEILSSSDEYKRLHRIEAVMAMYPSCLGREASREEAESWVDTGRALRHIYQDIYNSDEAINYRG